MVQKDKTHMLIEVADVSGITNISCFSDSCSSTRDACCNGLRANSLNAIKILANLLIAIDPTCHRHKKIPSMPFSGIQGIGENFNGIQGINSWFTHLQL